MNNSSSKVQNPQFDYMYFLLPTKILYAFHVSTMDYFLSGCPICIISFHLLVVLIEHKTNKKSPLQMLTNKISIFTHLKLGFTSAPHKFNLVKITHISTICIKIFQFNPDSAGIDFSRQNLLSVDGRF